MNCIHVAGSGHSRRIVIDTEPAAPEEGLVVLRDAQTYLLNALIQIKTRRAANPDGFTELRTERVECFADANSSIADASMSALNELDAEGRVHLSLSDLEGSILLNLAYVNLSLNNFLPALTYARQILLKGTGASEQNRFLAQSYAAEAFCMLGEASNVDPAFNANSDGLDVSAAHRLHNFATALVYQGDLDGALAKYLQAYALSPLDPVLLRGAMYVYMRQGKLKEALLLCRRLNPSIQ